jgi:hypothetical protein
LGHMIEAHGRLVGLPGARWRSLHPGRLAGRPEGLHYFRTSPGGREGLRSI